jgi:hypothetical protein
MARSNRKRSNQRRRGDDKAKADIWQAPQPMPELLPVTMPTDIGAMLRSLGDPPMQHGTAAAYYFNTVIERASGVALALAFSAELVGDTPSTAG